MKGRALALTMVLLVGGCQSRVSTTIDVRSDKVASVGIEVTMLDEAAQALRDDPSLDARVGELLAQRTGGTPKRQEEKDSITWKVTGIDYSKLESSSLVAGVGSASLKSAGKDKAQLDVILVVPTELQEALTKAVSDEEDGLAVARTVAATTYIVLDVSYPGPIASVKDDLNLARADGTKVHLEQTLAEYKADKVTVVGSTSAPIFTLNRVLIGVGVLLVLGFVLWRRRRV